MGDEQMTQEQKGKTPVLDVQNLTKIYVERLRFFAASAVLKPLTERSK